MLTLSLIFMWSMEINIVKIFEGKQMWKKKDFLFYF
jgi:hypothetical protein